MISAKPRGPRGDTMRETEGWLSKSQAEQRRWLIPPAPLDSCSPAWRRCKSPGAWHMYLCIPRYTSCKFSHSYKELCRMRDTHSGLTAKRKSYSSPPPPSTPIENPAGTEVQFWQTPWGPLAVTTGETEPFTLRGL